MPKPFRGEIWWVDWPSGRDSEPAGHRPALIVQNDSANQSKSYHNTIVLAISTAGLPVWFHIPLTPNVHNGLSRPSFVKCEQVMIISESRLERCMGEISSEEMSQVNHALKLVLDLR